MQESKAQKYKNKEISCFEDLDVLSGDLRLVLALVQF
jgi:hypothetical protein